MFDIFNELTSPNRCSSYRRTWGSNQFPFAVAFWDLSSCIFDFWFQKWMDEN